MSNKIRLLYLVSHPIQYQAPLLRMIAQEPKLDLSVGFTRDRETQRFDPGFGSQVSYDVPLLRGYSSVRADRGNIRQLIRDSDVVWLHGWGSWLHFFSIVIAKLYRKPILMRSEAWECAYREQSGWRAFVRARYHRAIFRFCTIHLAIGTRNSNYLVRHGVQAERIVSVPYSVDNDRFASSGDEFNGQEGIVLYCGKLTPRKMSDVLIQAWPEVKRAIPHASLQIVGDGELRDTIMLAAEADDSIDFLGFVNQGDLPAIYARAGVFVLAGLREPWGLAVNEAMAAGTAVVVSDQVGCAADLVTPECGRVVPPGDHKALATALIEVLQAANEMGRAAADRVQANSFGHDVSGLLKAIDLVTVGANDP